MTTGKVDFTGVQATMLITLFLRASDYKDQAPILGDRFAAEAVETIDYDWTKIDKPNITRTRFGVALRAKQLDEWAADFLRRHPDATVLQLACCVDSRAFRLDPPAGVRQLLRRLADHFRTGELIFDGVAPWIATTTQLLKKYLSRWYEYPAYWTATRDTSDIERWNPRLRYRDHVAVMAQYEQITDPTTRRIYRLSSRFEWSKNWLRVFRAEF